MFHHAWPLTYLPTAESDSSMVTTLLHLPPIHSPTYSPHSKASGSGNPEDIKFDEVVGELENLLVGGLHHYYQVPERWLISPPHPSKRLCIHRYAAIVLRKTL